MKKNLILACAFCVLSVVVAVLASPLVFVFSVAFAVFALWAAYLIGMKRGLVVYEDDLPREIYQVVGVMDNGDNLIAILRDKKKNRLACRSLDKKFMMFTIKGEPGEKFFIPNAIGSIKFTGALDSSVGTA